MSTLHLPANFFQSFILLLPFVVASLLFLLGTNLFIWIYDDTKLSGALVKSKKLLRYVFTGYVLLSIVITVIAFFNFPK